MAEKRRVLVAEDEGIVAKDVQVRLRSMGHEVVGWVTSGEDAVRLAEETRPDVVLMDIRLRGVLDGIEAAGEIRSRLRLPVVFLTAHADEATLQRARQVGPHGYVLKPFQDKDLEIVVELAVVRHAAEVALREREGWLATTLHSIGDGVVATDASGLVKLMNPVAERLTGWRAYEAAGHPLAEVLQLISEDTGKAIDDPVQQVLKDGRTVGLANHTLLVARDRREIPIGDSAAPITDDRGEIIGVVMVFRDLTAEREAQARLASLLGDVQRANAGLEQEKGFLSALFEAIPSGVMVVTGSRRVHAANANLARMFGGRVGSLDELLPGEALGCPDAARGEGSCGTLEGCSACVIRSSVDEALAGREVHRRKAEISFRLGSEDRHLVILVNAAPLEYLGQRMALLILEDATELAGLRALLGGTDLGFAGIVGRDRSMLEIFETIREVAQVTSPVLIEGESGTGKELVARAIHSESDRASRPFVAVNCGALPEGLLESELFGHVKGAFTGAIRDKKGRFELADGGSIFLDEIGDLSPAMQVKLLRVLQERSFERVGGERTLAVDVRIISATNRDLRREIAAGRFREDLFYRLCVVPVRLPPLRERVNDIPLIAEHILDRIAALSGRRRVALSREAMSRLMDHSWPGNVRELHNALEFALIKSRGEEIQESHLPANLRGSGPLVVLRRERRGRLSVEQVARALERTGGNKLEAARVLGVSRATLYRFLDSQPG